MTPRDREALEDLRAVIDRALGFPIADFEALERLLLLLAEVTQPSG